MGDEFYITLGKVWLMDSNSTQFCGTNRCKITWMREEYTPSEKNNERLQRGHCCLDVNYEFKNLLSVQEGLKFDFVDQQ